MKLPLQASIFTPKSIQLKLVDHFLGSITEIKAVYRCLVRTFRNDCVCSSNICRNKLCPLYILLHSVSHLKKSATEF
ncbi:hypothetical protein KSS87_013750 [Heliosperma pusillum]|nr:hypothetical protein KSS87_013750 [Heliosperma pusillum]